MLLKSSGRTSGILGNNGVLHSPPLKQNSPSNSFQSPRNKLFISLPTMVEILLTLFSCIILAILSESCSIQRNTVHHYTCVLTFLTENLNPHIIQARPIYQAYTPSDILSRHT